MVKYIKNWGADIDSFIEVLSEQLLNYGFEDVPAIEKESGALVWLSKLNETLFLSFSVIPEYCGHNEVSFDVDISVRSKYFANIVNKMYIHECDSMYKTQRKMQFKRRSLYLLTVQLSWLKIAECKEAGSRFWRLIFSKEDKCVNELIKDFVCYGIPFINNISSEEVLAHTLMHLETLRRKASGAGPLSPDQYCYAALLLSHIGRSDQALRELERGRSIELDSIASKLGRNSDQYTRAVEMTKCRYEKYEKYIHGEGRKGDAFIY
jgi:hypothetical protein